jgi:hypothetical protein
MEGTASTGTAAVSGEKSKRFRAVAINHIWYQVNEYAKTRDFYANLLGVKIIEDTGTQCKLMIGDTPPKSP